MEKGLLDLHNILRWIVFVLLLWSIIIAFTGWQKGKVFSNSDKRIWSFTIIAATIQFLVGVYLLLLGRFGILNTTLPEGTSVMKNSVLRFFWIEHPLMMLISVALISIGAARAKKPWADKLKFRSAFFFFVVALIIILFAIPWPWRVGVGRPYLPGM